MAGNGIEFETYDERTSRTDWSRYTGFDPDNFLAETRNRWTGLEKELKVAVETGILTARDARGIENHYYCDQLKLLRIKPFPGGGLFGKPQLPVTVPPPDQEAEEPQDFQDWGTNACRRGSGHHR